MNKFKYTYIHIVFVLLLSSCSNDDKLVEDCEIKLWSMRKTCSPDCVYTAIYGPDMENTTELVTNEATWDYYKINTDAVVSEEDLNVKSCWEGEK